MYHRIITDLVNIIKLHFIYFLTLFLTSCITNNHRGNYINTEQVNNKFDKHISQAGDFILQYYKGKYTDPNQKVIIYIEGDGDISDGLFISLDPTPKYPITLALAMHDSRANVYYLNRPCQYLKEYNPLCQTNQYWVGKRWSPEVINSINIMINKIAQDKQVQLIGFSGGGGVAVLVAAINPNIDSIITIGGMLDHILFTEYHASAPCTDSLNPIDFTEYVKNITQLHLIGQKDKVIPISIVENFVRKIDNSNTVNYLIFEDFDHMNYWQDEWENILTQYIYNLNND